MIFWNLLSILRTLKPGPDQNLVVDPGFQWPERMQIWHFAPAMESSIIVNLCEILNVPVACLKDMFWMQEALKTTLYLDLYKPQAIDALLVKGKAKMKQSLPLQACCSFTEDSHFFDELSLNASQQHNWIFCCIQKCSRNSGCRCLHNGLPEVFDTLLYAYVYPPLGPDESVRSHGSSLLLPNLSDSVMLCELHPHSYELWPH